ncbi:hypothetical protein ABK040_008122 [Willaertia magna]
MKKVNIKVLPANYILHHPFPSTDPIKFIRYDADKGIICTENKLYEINYSTRTGIEFNEIKKLESINKIKFIDYSKGHIIIVNELNEFYFRDDEEDCDFTKINILFNENIQQFNINAEDLFILTKNHSLYTLENYYEQFKDNNKSLQFTKIEQNLKITKMSSSKSHIILLDIFGSIYVKGDNQNGELGLGDDFEDVYEIKNFTEVELPFKVKQIFANYGCSYIVSEDNELFGSGFNDEGELGVDNNEIITAFTKIIIDNFCKPTTSFHCYSSYSYTKFISDAENNIYLCGGETYPKDYGIILEDEDESLWKFTKIGLKLNNKYLQLIPLEEFTLFIGTDYKINTEDDEEEIILGEKCFEVLQKEKLVDLQLVVNCGGENNKKRKRNELY